MAELTKVIEASFEWTTAVLFRPFNPKKWLILGFIALMAGYITGGSFNSNSYNSAKNGKEAHAAETPVASSRSNAARYKQPSVTTADISGFIAKKIKDPRFLAIVVIIAVLMLVFLIIMMWLSSRFSFIFLEDVVNNDASIRAPFKIHKELGNSFFKFSLFLMVLMFISFGLPILLLINSLIKLGVFNKAQHVGFMAIFLACLPYGIYFLILIITWLIAHTINNDFVLIIMLKDKIKILKAWPLALSILMANKPDFVKYLFVKVGLVLCARFIYFILSLVCFIGLILPAAIVALIFYLISRIIPQQGIGLVLFSVSAFTIIMPIVFFLIYCIMCLYLPFAVFFRTLSIKFLGRLKPHYNLFDFIPPENNSI